MRRNLFGASHAERLARCLSAPYAQHCSDRDRDRDGDGGVWGHREKMVWGCCEGVEEDVKGYI